MTTVAVVAHTGKYLDGGLDRLRAVLAHEGVDAPLWYEVPKSKKAPARIREAVDAGADLVFVWGGDGMVQRSIDALSDPAVAVAIVPAGTANLLASELGIPSDIDEAVAIGLHGGRRALDVGVVNGERFVVMAGTGFDARMIRDTDKALKARVGRVAYLWTAARNLRAGRVGMTVRVDGSTWFEGPASCLLVGNVGTVLGGLPAFPEAAPDDGVLEVGVVTADGVREWARVLAALASRRPDRSPLTRMTAGREVEVHLDAKLPYELDGGDRKKTKHLTFGVEPSAITVCVPEEGR